LFTDSTPELGVFLNSHFCAGPVTFTPLQILIVDDEASIAQLVAMALKRSGFQARHAGSASEALAGWSDDIELLITDCHMPDLNGEQLANRLRARKPNLSVVYMSGNSPCSFAMEPPLTEGVNFIRKPFEMGELLSLVQNQLAPAESS
jgi:two-component system cell cycle sensor histidine kinase/response regulator CckA